MPLYNKATTPVIRNVRDFGAVGDGVTDDTAAFDAAMVSGSYVIVPQPKVAYLIKYFVVPTKTTVVGQGRPQINIKRSGSTVVSSLKTLSVIENLYLNSLDASLEWNRIGIESATNVVVRNCRIDGFRHASSAPNSWGLFIDKSSFVRVENCVFDNNTQSDIAIVDQCNHITVTECKGVSNFVINIEPNASFVSSKILIENCRIQTAMTWDYSDVASPIDNAVFKNCVIDLFRYTGGNVMFDNTSIATFQGVSPDSGGRRGGKIANRNSFGYGKQLNDDPFFHKIVNSGGDQTQSWTFFYSPDANVIAFKEDSRGRYLSLNPGGINTTASIVRKFSVTPGSLYTVRALLNVYHPITPNGAQQLAIEWYDTSDTIIGGRKYLTIDKKSGLNGEESEWDEKQFFFNAPANCTSVKLFVMNCQAGATSEHRLNIQYLKLNQVILNGRNFSSDEVTSQIQSGPSTTTLPQAGIHNQSVKGQTIYSPDPGASGCIGWVCVSSGNPGTWRRFGVLEA